jgi:hypothetical protein
MLQVGTLRWAFAPNFDSPYIVSAHRLHFAEEKRVVESSLMELAVLVLEPGG